MDNIVVASVVGNIISCAQTFGIDLGLKLRKRWHVDGTCFRIEGRWCYLYHAIDEARNLVDAYLSGVRD